MNRNGNRLMGALGGVLLALVVVGTASAYWKQTPATITISGPRGPIDCGDWVDFTATVRDASGNLIAKDGPVDWSFLVSPSDKDHIAPKQSRTDKNGVASTRIRFACVPGDRVIQATADRISGTITVQVTTDDDDDKGKDNKGHGAGVLGTSAVASIRRSAELPRTSTAASSSSSSQLPVILALMALLVVSGTLLRRRARPRR